VFLPKVFEHGLVKCGEDQCLGIEMRHPLNGVLLVRRFSIWFYVFSLWQAWLDGKDPCVIQFRWTIYILSFFLFPASPEYSESVNLDGWIPN
jgi:hypothetical protein